MNKGPQRHELGRVYQQIETQPLDSDLSPSEIDRRFDVALAIIQRRKPFALQLYRGEGAQTFHCGLEAYKAWR